MANDEHGELTPDQARAVELALEGKDFAAIGREIGRHRSCVSRWLREHPQVSAVFAERQQEQLGSVTRRVRGMAEQAAAFLGEVMSGKVSGTAAELNARVKAAIAILDRAGLTADGTAVPAKVTSKREVQKRARQMFTVVDGGIGDAAD